MLRPIHRWVVVSIAGTIWALPVTASAPKPDPPANAVLVSAPRDPEVLPTEALTGSQMRAIFISTALALPASVALLGGLVWWPRT